MTDSLALTKKNASLPARAAANGSANSMSTLTDLINGNGGRGLLRSKGVHASQETFASSLKPPSAPELAQSLGLQPGQKLICSGQQLYVDYRQSVTKKIATAHELAQRAGLSTVLLWIDTDRSGSDSLITKFAWPANSKKGPISIAPPKKKEVEIRFVDLDGPQLSRAIDKLGTHLRHSGVNRGSAKQRFKQLRALFVDDRPGTLADFNHQMTRLLLEEQMSPVPPSLIASEIIEQAYVVREMNALLNQIDDVIAVFNETIDSLKKQGINPQLRDRTEDYLPLFYSCEQDDERFRLHHITEGNDHFAIGACRARHVHKFFLGSGQLSIDSLLPTGRWSPDVFLPALLNDVVSGFVAGKSSAIYLIVLNAVLKQVLGKSPVPVLAPESLATAPNGAGPIDSLLYNYFDAR
jgi:hypothetical protein